MTRVLTFRAIADSELVLSLDGSTAGGHQTLGYIPGSALMGVVAGKLYPCVDPETAFQLFHSGATRFSNAYPCDPHGRATLPVPLSWYGRKGVDVVRAGVLQAEHVLDLSSGQRSGAGALQRLPGAFFNQHGYSVASKTLHRGKTAIDPGARGAPRPHALFEYETVASGTEFLFSVAFDDEVDRSIPDLVKGALLSGGVRVGRSRGAEFGRLDIRVESPISPHDEVDVEQIGDARAFAAGDVVLLHALSDLALLDGRTGCQTLQPTGEHFGIDGGAWRMDRSAIRSRRYSPVNRKRGMQDSERVLILRGSVIAIELSQELAMDGDKGLRQRLARGVGMYRAEGFGIVSAAPSYLGDKSPSFGFAEPVSRVDTARPVGSLANWLVARNLSRYFEDRKSVLGRRWTEALLEAYRMIPEGQGPSLTQWGRVRQIAQSARSAEEARAALFDSRSGALASGASRRVWEGAAGASGEPSLGALLRELLKQVEAEAVGDIQRAGMGGDDPAEPGLYPHLTGPVLATVARSVSQRLIEVIHA